jgi:hypothetical protein
VALFGTDARAGTATDAIQHIGEGHHHGVVFVIIIILIVLIAFEQLKHFTRADLVTAAATDAIRLIQVSHKGGGVRHAASGDSGDGFHI